MKLQRRTLLRLRDLIVSDTGNKSHKELNDFFAFIKNRDYNPGSAGFSRIMYTDFVLEKINGSSDIDHVIKDVFSPINFIDRFDFLDSLIDDFNKYLMFDSWKVVRVDSKITFKRVEEHKIPVSVPQEPSEDEFLRKEFEEVSIESLNLDSSTTAIIQDRIREIEKCLSVNASLSTVFLCGSSLEGILLGLAIANPSIFNKANAAPRDKQNAALPFQKWTLASFIDVAHELGYIREDVKRFSHSLRNFRNYIHPFEQMASKFKPDEHTARLCWQVVKAAIYHLANRVDSSS